jgi:REP element-mobilizing transposase RayT
MPRPLRVEYPGAIYHLMSRGDHREPIFRDDTDRRVFLKTLGEASVKTGWQIHAYCLMGNHFHLVAETPQPNLVAGMKWLLGTYTGRFNRRHKLFGHLFSGRYKSLVIDERGGDYLRTACDYVHLNPVRAGLIVADQPLSAYAWSSYPLYLLPGRRAAWLRVDRLLGEHGMSEDSAEGRIEFQRRMEQRRSEGDPADRWAVFRRGWRLGANDFAQRLAERLGRRGHRHELARERKETDEQRAERLVREWMQSLGWSETEITLRPKGDPKKTQLALRLREETPMTRQWIAQRLSMGSASYISHLTAKGKDCRL